MSIKLLKIIICLFVIPYLFVYLQKLGDLFFLLGFSGSNSIVYNGGLILFVLLFIVTLYLLYKIIRATEKTVLYKMFLGIFGIFILCILFTMNAESIWRIEAKFRGIQLLEKNQTYSWREKNCRNIPEKNNICAAQAEYPGDLRSSYFECSDGSNFCGGRF